MKRLLISFLIILMITGNCLYSTAESENMISEGIFSYYIKEDNTAGIALCTDSQSRVVKIPERLGGYKVTEIRAGAFSECKGCEAFESANELFEAKDGILYKEKTLVCYPPGKRNDEFITSRNTDRIESYAFVSNPFLSEVTLSSRITVIPEGCFAGCSGLTSVVSEKITEIGDSAFAFCEKLEGFDFPDTLKIIGNGAFYGCGNIKELKLPDGIEKIGEMAFEKCLSVTDICIPAKVTGVEGWIYSVSPELKTVSVSKNHKAYIVEDNILYNNENPKKLVFCPPGSGIAEITVPSDVDVIGKSAFENHKTIKKIVVADCVSSIESHAFYGCANLESIQLNDGLEKIGDYAFFGCKSLGDVKVYSSVSDIGSGAFGNCPGVNLSVAEGSSAYQYAKMDNVKYTVDITQEAVVPEYWAERYIRWSEENGITADVDDYKVPLNREGCSWLVVNFYENIKGKTEEVSQNYFSDTSASAPNKAYELGILSGVGGGLFNPSAPITRQELCVCLVKLVTALGGEIPAEGDVTVFRDDDSIAEWSRDYVNAAYKSGIITGFPDGRIIPDGNATIEEALVMLYNVSGILR